ncbi:hypothetical protein ES704_03660 [subsurface metagenome]|jgi:hypothetical protein
MAITLEGTRITVEFEDGDPKGDSWDDPYTLDDVVTAIANVTKQGNQIYIPYSLYIEGLDTYFLAEDMQVYFAGEIDDVYSLYVNLANFKSQGNIRGMHWADSKTNSRLNFNGTIEVINSVFGYFRTLLFMQGTSIKRSMFIYCTYPYISSQSGVTLEDVTFLNAQYGILPQNNFSSALRVKIIANTYGVAIGYGGSFNMSKLILVDNTYDFIAMPEASNRIVNLTDSQIDVNSYYVKFTWSGDVTLNLISTFKINIENGDGGTAKLYDKDNNLIWTEALLGELEKAVTYYKHYVETDGTLVADDKTTYEPFKLVISKANYLDLTIPNITIEPGEETHITGKIVKPTYFHQEISGKVEVSEVSGKVEISEVSGTIVQ